MVLEIKPYILLVTLERSSFDSKFEPGPVTLPLLQKAIPEGNQKIWVQNQWPSSWGSTQEQHWQVWKTSTNLGNNIQWTAGPEQSLLKKHAATLVILTQFSQVKDFLCHVNDNFFLWNLISMDFATTCSCHVVDQSLPIIHLALHKKKDVQCFSFVSNWKRGVSTN